MERFHTSLVTDAKRFDHLDVDSLHEFRRNLRRWRYLNETLMSRREQRTNRRLARVIALQDALGEMQNCEVIRLFLRPLTLPRAELQSLDQKLTRQQRTWLAKAGERLGAVGRIRV
jgi:CHAD domain-containing protein